MSETQTISPEVRAYMSALGSKKTEAKERTSRENLAKGSQSRRKDPMTLPCLCGQCPDNPKTTCPRGRLLRQRARNVAQTKEAVTQ
jgi:TPP-dependent indolepyruvate ferredoxin oxidoreductase alpha subunit